MILLDTNMLSESLRYTRAAQVETWLSVQDGDSSYLRTISDAQLRYGVAIPPAGKRRTAPIQAPIQAIESIPEEDLGGRIAQAFPDPCLNALHRS